jgi:uncharacterized protein (TIGR03086 family)
VPPIDLEPAALAVTGLLDQIADKQLGDPTPCADAPVASLLDHLMGLSLAFTWAARKTTASEAGDTSSRPGLGPTDHLDPNWRSELPKRLQDLVEAWREPSAWEGMTEAGGMTMPAEVAAMVALDELVLHGWDLARATGQRYTCDPASSAAVLDFVTVSAQPDQAHLREGLFGPVIEVPDDAPAFDRALGLAGRDPAWAPEPAADPADVVRRLFESYHAQDRETAERLIGAEFTFTSPQDDHIDRAAYFDTCFPTANRTRTHEMQRVAVTGDDVFVMYEYELLDGAVHRNAELLTVRRGQVVEAQVFFGGRYDR